MANMFLRNLHKLPQKPIQKKISALGRQVCEDCGLIETNDTPHFHHHHRISLGVYDFEKWKNLGEECHQSKTVCPWCHLEEHIKMKDKKGAQGVLNWLIAWKKGRFNAKQTYAPPK